MSTSTPTPRRAYIKSALLPGVWPRTVELFTQGFPHLSFLIASVFGMLRLLPAGHAYLNPRNFGRFSCRQVIAAAADELTLSWKEADKILAFVTILAGLVMMVIQFVLMIVALIIAPASAQGTIPTSYEGFFTTAHPKEDLAFKMLDMVFGVPKMFGMDEGDRQPFHEALQALFQFYSFGILLVGIFILIYIVIVIVAETAQSGVPFGKRFKQPWAPIRIILFFALLIPISNGLNAGQYIVLYAAKGGSGLASNGWQMFNEKTQRLPMGARDTLIAKPQPPDLVSLPAFIMLAKTCQMAVGTALSNHPDVQAWVIYNNKSEKLGEKTFQDITAELTKDRLDGYAFHLRFGEKNQAYDKETGNVKPYCGELFFYTSDISEPGSALIQQTYFEMVQMLWDGTGSSGVGRGKQSNIQGIGNDMRMFARGFYDVYILGEPKEETRLPPSDFRGLWGSQLEHYMSGAAYTYKGYKYPKDENGGKIGEAVKEQVEKGKLDLEDGTLKYGWAGAAIWYNKIAEQNGSLVASVRHYPLPSRYPEIMEKVAKQRAAGDTITADIDKFNPSSPSKKETYHYETGEEEVAQALHQVYKYWQQEESRTDPSASRRRMTENIIVDSINLFFGTSGLFAMCENTDVHPLAQLSSLGKGMIEHAIRGFGGSLLLGLGGSAASILAPSLGKAGYAASSMMMTIAGIGLMAGFILFYLMPFLPFMYFFFAAGTWIKGIFEAVAGAPLWALGHLHIDGEGISGEAAWGGYVMIFETFIRPILIIFGLIASLVLFGAMVKVLNDIFYLLLSNLPSGASGTGFCFTDAESGGSYARGPIDEFFFTVVYVIIVFLIGMSSFKLIDAIPKSLIGRWLGEDASAFADQQGDVAEGLMQRMTMGAGALGSRLESGMGGVAGNLQEAQKSFMTPEKAPPKAPTE